MKNRRIISFFLGGIVLCSLVLAWLHVRSTSYADLQTRPTLFVRAPERVTRVSIEDGTAMLTMARGVHGDWRLEHPFAAQIDGAVVERLLDAFEQTRIRDTLTFRALRKLEISLRDLGLAPARVRVSVASDQAVDTFDIGDRTPGGGEVYVRVNQFENVFAVPAVLLSAIPRGADALRTRNLFTSARTHVSMIELRVPNMPFVKLVRTDDTWRLVQPEAAPADAAAVARLLDALYAARIERYVWPDATATAETSVGDVDVVGAMAARRARYGLTDDMGVGVTLFSTNSAQPERVAFGGVVEAETNRVYALAQDASAIVTVPDDVAVFCRAGSRAFRDTRLFHDAASDIRRLQIATAESQCVLVLGTNGVWMLETPILATADQIVVRKLIDRLLRIRSLSVLTPCVMDSTTCTARVTMTLAHGTREFSVQPATNMTACVSFATPREAYAVAWEDVPPLLTGGAPMETLLDLNMLSIPAGGVRRLTVKADAREVAVEYDAASGQWRMQEGTRGEFSKDNAVACATAVSALFATRVAALRVTEQTRAGYGFATPYLAVAVDVAASDAVRKNVLVGAPAPEGGRFAMVLGQDSVYVISDAVVAQLAAPLGE